AFAPLRFFARHFCHLLLFCARRAPDFFVNAPAMVISTDKSEICTCIHRFARFKVYSSDEPVGNWTATPTRQEAHSEMDSELCSRFADSAAKVQSKDAWRVGRRGAGPD
ncbi:MAG TPA: hypothetical protein VND90_14440, partial [Terracidiphilus sp.]|nr:hypothetical protein [Terracidiphilus sp.]